MDRIEREFCLARRTPSDIHEHMTALYDLSSTCSHIVEGGVRYVVSTWAFLLGCACQGGTVVSYCWNLTPEIQRAIDLCKEDSVPWTFYDGDWLKREIPGTDLLFIDTNHFYSQLKKELKLHGSKARRYIVLHDTQRFRDKGADDKTPGLWKAVEELIGEGCWRVKQHYDNCNGLTILERTNDEDQYEPPRSTCCASSEEVAD